jgi:hypothetical protein
LLDGPGPDWCGGALVGLGLACREGPGVAPSPAVPDRDCLAGAPAAGGLLLGVHMVRGVSDQ